MSSNESASVELTDIEGLAPILGHPVYVDKQGVFKCSVGRANMLASSYSDLESQVARRVRSNKANRKISIPLIITDGVDILEDTFLGYNAKTGSQKWKTKGERNYSSGCIPDQITEEIRKLMAEVRDARNKHTRLDNALAKLMPKRNDCVALSSMYHAMGIDDAVKCEEDLKAKVKDLERRFGKRTND
jgi:hypothetical protein